MHFSIEQDDGIVIFTLREPRFDAHVAGDVKAEFLIICQPDVEALIINLSEVEYCDSTGLSALLLAYRQMREYGAPVVLVGVQPTVFNLLKISQLDRVYPVFDTVEDALADLQE